MYRPLKIGASDHERETPRSQPNAPQTTIGRDRLFESYDRESRANDQGRMHRNRDSADSCAALDCRVHPLRGLRLQFEAEADRETIIRFSTRTLAYEKHPPQRGSR